MHVETLSWVGGRPGHVRMIDQTRLPEEAVEIDVRTTDAMVDAIKRLVVRGAPALGVAAAYGVLLGVQNLADRSPANVVGVAQECAARLAAARPTAVNLFWGLKRMTRAAERTFASGGDGEAVLDALFAEARAIHESDKRTCRQLGEHGAALLREGCTVLTHCNAGALATGGIGSALAPIYVARERGMELRVIADETRPLLQGARLTCWELQRAGVDVTLIPDSAAAGAFSAGLVDLVLVGADRIARNGDVCNKVGTYGVAVLAREHKVPFWVVAPLSTFDAAADDGSRIPIEERAPEEVTRGFGRRTAPEGVRVWNPAFDVTPARLVTGIVTEVGRIEQPDEAKIVAALQRGGALPSTAKKT